LSEGGPLVHPDVTGLVVTGMASEAGMPPLVVDADSDVIVDLQNADSGVVVGDGRMREEVTPPEQVRISRDWN
jgi:NAD+ kinase